ncbi:transforming growth factor-beta-induced protein ig-h3-like [Argonauta hians]
MKQFLFLVATCLLLVVQAKRQFNGTLAEAMSSLNTLSEIVGLLNQSSILDNLDNTGMYTVFVPNNRAIQDLDSSRLDAWKNDSVLLEKIVKYHMAYGQIKHDELVNDKSIKSLQGESIWINVYNARHAVTAEGCKIVNFDNVASNGVFHIINEVMLPPDGRIAEILALDPDFSIFYSLINGTKYVDILNDNFMTLFAPNNAAFNKMNEDVVAQLQGNFFHKETFLKYHMVHGILWTPGMHKSSLRTFVGDTTDVLSVKIRARDQVIFIGNAQIINRDISASNGVIHTIDSVLIPPSKGGIIG